MQGVGVAKCDPGPRPRVCHLSSFDQILCPGWKERQMRTLVLDDLGQSLPASACSPGGTRTLMGNFCFAFSNIWAEQHRNTCFPEHTDILDSRALGARFMRSVCSERKLAGSLSLGLLLHFYTHDISNGSAWSLWSQLPALFTIYRELHVITCTYYYWFC